MEPNNCGTFVGNVGLDGCELGISIRSGDSPADCRLIADCGSNVGANVVGIFKAEGYKAFNCR